EEGARRGRDATVVIEVKHPTYFLGAGFDIGALLMRELEASGWVSRGEQVIVECFELSVLDQLRSAGLTAPVVFLLEHAGAPADEIAQAEIARSRRGMHDYAWYRSDAGLDSLVGRVDGVSPSKRDILADEDPGAGLAARAHVRGLSVFTWTFRPENRFLEREHRLGGGAAAWGDWEAEWLRLVAS